MQVIWKARAAAKLQKVVIKVTSLFLVLTQKISRTWTSQKMMKKMAKSDGVNVLPFTTRVGAVSGVAEDDTAKDFFQLFIPDELLDMIVEETNRYARQCIARKPDQSGKTQAVKKCKHSLASMCCSGITTFLRHLCTGPKTKPLGLNS